MNQESKIPGSIEHLPADVEVYRLARLRSQIEREGEFEGYFKPSAFYRRPGEQDADGLSVQIASKCQLDETNGIRNCPLVRCHGVLSLFVQEITAASIDGYFLDVFPDPSQSDSEALIVNIPYDEADHGAAEHIATTLARYRSALWIRTK